MKLEDIYQFFKNPPPTYLCQELAICYILYVLLQGESYGTELIQRLETEYRVYRLSDTALYSAIKFLEEQKAITGYWKKLEGRGRPRRMYQISPEWIEQAQNLAHLWQEYINQQINDDSANKREFLYRLYSQQALKPRRATNLLKIEDIYEFFENPLPVYLCTELAVCYILSVLLHGESYGEELIQKLETEYRDYRLSDTVLYSAIKFLEDQKAITGYWKKLELIIDHTRPRRIYKIAPKWQEQAKDLARLWQEYVNTEERVEVLNALGNAYLSSGEYKRAINYFQQSLTLAREIGYISGQITSLIDLGNAHYARVNGNRVENIENSIAAYISALQVCTRDDFPEQWAEIQYSLGNAYSERFQGNKADNLELLIAAYQKALTVFTREAFPEKWASTCKNLGNAYTEKTHDGRLNNIDCLNNIEYAILFYQDALLIYTPERFPDESVIIREKLSNAHYLLEHYQRELEDASLSQPISCDEALARIEFVRGDLLALDVDALVNPTGLDLSNGGAIGLQLFERLGSQLYETLQNQPLLRSGEVFVTDAGSLRSRYLIHTPTEEREGRHTTASIVRGVSAALAKADSLSDVRTIAFPSVGTGAAGFDPADLASKVLRAVTNHLKQGSQLEKVIFTFIDEFAYQVYVSVYQTLLSETSLAYGISLTISKEATGVGGEIEVSVYLKQMGADNQNDYLLRVPQTQAVGSELNIILTAPGFQFDSDNTASLPLDPDTAQETQTARFCLTALRPGNVTITAELYRGDTFETNLETTVQVAGFDEESFLQTRITTQPRPVPQPDFILRVQPVWNETNSACIFNYQLRSFRFPTVFSGETNYQTVSFSNSWLEQMRGMLANTLENISGATREDGKSSLVSLGQYLFQHFFPTELQSDFRNLIPHNYTFTLLILADQDTWIPWELLHDCQKFLGDRFIIGRWLQELNDTRPYEFPVGAINVAHYANVEQPELWTTLLETPGAPPPQPLPEGVLHDSTEAIRGLHLIRYSQSSDSANRRNAPVTLDNANDTEDIEYQIRPAKLNLRRNRPLVTLGYVKTHTPELTTLEQTWASAFIRAGCSGFIGSLWAVEPDVEAAFISSFYNRLWTGASLGEAFSTSRQLARTVAPDSLDYLAYVLFGDPMARPYRPVEGKGYAVVEPIGRDIDDPLPPGVPVRFRLGLRRTPPVWHEERVIEVAENLTFENLQVHVKTIGLQVTPDSPIAMSLAPTGNYLGWFTLVAPPEMAGNSALVQVYFMDGVLPIHSLMFSLNIIEGGESA